MSESGFDIGLGDPARAGVFEVDAGDLPALAAAARDAGLRVRRIDLHGCRDRQTLLLRIAMALEFPPGWGRNWDGLMDALRDLSWLPAPGLAPGYALFFDASEALQAARPADMETLLDMLAEAARWWADDDVPFWAFIAPGDTARGAAG